MGIETKKCPYCGEEYKEDNSITPLIISGPKKCCDECMGIQKLQDLLKEYFQNFEMKKDDDPIFQKNMIEEDFQPNSRVTCYHPLDYKLTYEVTDRSKAVTELIEGIKEKRYFIYNEIGGQIEILDSIYDGKHIPFWTQSGNLIRYVHQASLEYVKTKLIELLSGDKCHHTIKKIRNIIENDKKNIDAQKIYEVYNYENGDVLKIQFENLPIKEYLKLEKEALEDRYKQPIDAIQISRDKQCAHMDNIDVNDREYLEILTYRKIRRIYSLIKCLYDGFLYIVAPDQFTNLFVQRNIWLDNINSIAEEFEKKK